MSLGLQHSQYAPGREETGPQERERPRRPKAGIETAHQRRRTSVWKQLDTGTFLKSEANLPTRQPKETEGKTLRPQYKEY